MENNNNGIKLTLDGFKSAAAQAAPTEPVKPEETFASPESMLTEEEKAAVDKFAEQIDITDSSLILSYGSAAQKKISDFSDTALSGVKTKDFGELGAMITDLLSELRGINDEEAKGFKGLFRRSKNKIENMKIKYSKAEESVNGIAEALEDRQLVLLKDIAVFDNLYEMNLTYLKEATMYIAAGKKRLARERDVTLAEMKSKAETSGLPEDAQAANDFAEQCNRFERRLHDLELTRTVAIQTAPQIRLLQNNDTMMSEKIQTIIMNTIPLWKSQMVLALGIAHSAEAMEAGRSVTDMTNELLRQNASKLHQATVDITRESERGVVDIETLKNTNEELIATLDEVRQIQNESGARRREAEAELARIEAELKSKLLDIGNGKNG